MNIRLMRTIDRMLGVPFCWALGGVYLLFPLRKEKPPPETVKRVLVIKFFGLGSVILSTASLAMIKTGFPQAKLTFLSFAQNRELLERISVVDEVWTIDSRSLWSFIKDTFLCVKEILRRKYDVVFDFEFFSKFSTLLNGLTRAPFRVAFALPTLWRSLLITDQVPIQKNYHVKENFCYQVSAVTNQHHTFDIIAPEVFDSDRISLQRKVEMEGRRLIAVNVNAGATFLERRWMPARFAELISSLLQREDCVCFFIGSKAERTYVQDAINLTSCPERCKNVAGLLTIPELAALFVRCDLLISNDSGPLHLAAALGIPTIGLYGPESPAFYGSLGDHSITVYKGIPCSPCMNVYSAKDFRCPYDALCMKEIRVDEVRELVAALSLVS